jgi:hypothetical protein
VQFVSIYFAKSENLCNLAASLAQASDCHTENFLALSAPSNHHHERQPLKRD